MFHKYFIISALVIIFYSCSSPQKSSNNIELSHHFKEKWFDGLAELNVYELKQFRYHQQRSGYCVSIFVKEDFHKKKQVKLDHYDIANNKKEQVLKMNLIKDFTTGIYDYNTMTSVFTSLDKHSQPFSIKETFSSQEWCGHVFSQLNRKHNGYSFNGYSYFESEGDIHNQHFKSCLLEDELFNLIRISPERIPTGELEVVPNMEFLRFKHQKVKPQVANLTLEELPTELLPNEIQNTTHTVLLLSLSYQKLARNLKIYFEKQFPYKILYWEEIMNDEQNTYVLTKSMRLDYWNKNSNEFTWMRDSLGI